MRAISFSGVCLLCAVYSATVFGADALSVCVASMETATDLNLTKGNPQGVAGPADGKALLFGAGGSADFEGRIDLKSRGADPKDFDLIKLEVKADRGAFVRIGLENHPGPGDLSYWYVLDGLRGPLDWHTIYVDLTRPEEIKRAKGERMPWRKGMDKGTESDRGIQISGHVTDRNRKAQGPDRRIWLGAIRLVKEAVHLDWDQTQAPCTWGPGKDLVYTYPLTVTNKLDKPITVKLRLAPFQAKEAHAALEQDTVTLAAREAQTVKAKITLPAAAAAGKKPLFCERFSAFASAEGVPDSEVTIVRSSDPIHLTVTVPFAEEKLAYPLLAPPSKLPAALIHLDEALAKENAAVPTKGLVENALENGLYQYNEKYAAKGNVDQFRKTLIAAAILHDLTGEGKYLKTASELLNALPDIWAKFQKSEEAQPIREISSGVVARWNDANHYVLGLGWLVCGTTRSPYYYGTAGNGRHGSMSSIAWAFDMLAPTLDPALRQRVLTGFFVPAALQCRNHYIGDSNQQATIAATCMYAGLATRNWPLVSFAYSSEHGLSGIADWCFDDDGIQIRKNYQTYTLWPMFWIMEMLYGRGLNLYEQDQKRLTTFVTVNPATKDRGGPFEDRYFWEFIRQQRITEE